MQSILINPSVRSRHPSQTSSESSASDSHYPPRSIRFAPLPDPRKNGDSAVFYPDDTDSDTPSPSSATLECPPSPRFSFKTTFPKSKQTSWSNFLRPLFNKPSLSSSLQDNHDSVYKPGIPLSRRRSTGCNSIASSKELDRAVVYRDGAPLTHTNSDSAARRSAPSSTNRRVLLNGRIYGRRPSSNTLQSESHEPDFVEWGYGGMGSVSNNANKDLRAHGVDWAKVQSSGKFNDHGDADVDDGSGMQWVRRRREQREREQKEREFRERSQETIPEIAIHPPTHDESSTMDEDLPSEHSDDRHVYQAINIPATSYRHRHHKPIHGPAHLGSNALLTSSETSLQKADLSSGTSSNGHSSDAEENREDSDTERDSSSDDDEDDNEQARITSKGAGVEKISRHKV